MKLRKLKPVAPQHTTSMKLPPALAQAKATGSKGPGGVPLMLVAPTASNVFVAGSFNNWHAAALPLKPLSGGQWVAEVKLPPGRYEYLFVVDGQWLPDPSAREAVPNPFGGFNSLLCVS